MKDTDPLLTRQQVATIFAVSPQTIYRWTAKGLLRGVKVGGVVRYRPNDVIALAASEGPA